MSDKESVPILQAKNLHKRYGAIHAVRGIDLQVQRGEIVGLLGPNGAGKTTTFYSICGLIKPSSGQILLGGKDITHAPIHRRSQSGLGYLSQEASVFRKLTVAENLSVALEQRGLSRTARRELLEKMLEQHGLENIRDRIGAQLSGGERRRTEVARIMATAPEILLMDEPFAGVDPISVEAIQKMIRRLVGDGLAILITDHTARDMLHICDRIYVVIDGEILAQGTADDIIANTVVRERYLGSSFQL